METEMQSFDIKQKVTDHALAAVGGAVAAGVLAGLLLARKKKSAEALAEDAGYAEYQDTSIADQKEKATTHHPIRSFLSSLAENLQDEIHMAKGMAVGAGLGAVMKQVEKSAPTLTPYFRPILESVHRKTGYGEFHSPLPEPVAPGDREETVDDGSWRPQAVR